MRTHHVVIRESRIVFNQLQGQRLELGDVLFWQSVRRNDETVAVISLDLVRAKDWMSWWHLSLLYSRAEIPVAPHHGTHRCGRLLQQSQLSKAHEVRLCQ
jgi:hypothetical protein